MSHPYIGKLAICGHGKLGRITGLSRDRSKFVGVNVVTGGKWQSVDPRIIRDRRVLAALKIFDRPVIGFRVGDLSSAE